MNFKVSLRGTPSKMLLEATKQLKREGQEISRTLPSGTTVKYIRGKDIDARGFGPKYTLYKEVTKPDGFRTITSENVIRDDVYINEIFFVEPNGWCPDYVRYYDKYFYIPQPGITNQFIEQQAKGLDRRGEILQDLLRKKVQPFNEASARRSEQSYREHCRRCYEEDPQSFRQYEQYSRKAEGQYRYEQAQNRSHSSSQSTGTGNTGASSTGRITREQFVDHMVEKLSHKDCKTCIDPRTLKDSEIRNLAKLFEVSESSVRNLDKATKRKLILKYHPDTNGNDELSTKIFLIVNNLKTAS